MFFPSLFLLASVATAAPMPQNGQFDTDGPIISVTDRQFGSGTNLNLVPLDTAPLPPYLPNQVENATPLTNTALAVGGAAAVGFAGYKGAQHFGWIAPPAPISEKVAAAAAQPTWWNSVRNVFRSSGNPIPLICI